MSGFVAFHFSEQSPKKTASSPHAGSLHTQRGALADKGQGFLTSFALFFFLKATKHLQD